MEIVVSEWLRVIFGLTQKQSVESNYELFCL